jgi:hypothetical protein
MLFFPRQPAAAFPCWTTTMWAMRAVSLRLLAVVAVVVLGLRVRLAAAEVMAR